MASKAPSGADSVARGTGSSGAQRYVDTLANLPGAEHVAVVDVAGERVLGEWGGPPGSARALLDRARRAADPAQGGRRDLEDVVSTTKSAFHLSRLVLAGPENPTSVWVSVRIDRARGSLTWSRGVLAGLGGPSGPGARPESPASRPGAAANAPDATHRNGGPATAPTEVPPPRTPTTPRSGPPVASPGPAPSPPWVALTATARTGTPPSPAPTPAREPATARSNAAMSSPAPDETAVTDELAASPLTVPAARPSPENTPGATSTDPEQRSSFAPVMVVLPPPSPLPDDGTSEEPAPMPAPIIVAPPPASDREIEDEPAGGTDPGEPAAAEPRGDDRPGASPPIPRVRLAPRETSPPVVPPSRTAEPSDVAAPTGEPSGFRRLIKGLRRPS